MWKRQKWKKFEIIISQKSQRIFRYRLIVSSRQEIDFEIDFIKLCKTKLNTTSLWSKQIRKIESSSNFWSKIEKTISLFRYTTIFRQKIKFYDVFSTFFETRNSMQYKDFIALYEFDNDFSNIFFSILFKLLNQKIFA